MTRVSALRSAAILVAATVVSALAACSSSDHGTLPAAAPLLRRSAAQMRHVTSARFSLRVSGTLGGVEVRRAEGVMSRDGRASGTVDLVEAGQLVEFDVVFVKGTVYLKGPTGPFQSVPSELAGTIYDPTDLLDPAKGVSRLLATASHARTVARDAVGGVDAYRVRATFDGRVLQNVVPNPVPPSVRATVWIGADEPDLLMTDASVPTRGGGRTNVTLTITDFNTPVHITPPPTT